MLFYYEAFNKNGGLVTGEVDASDEKDVVLYLEKKELIPSKIKSKEAGKKFSLTLATNIFASKLKSTEIIFMVRNLATAIKAGLSLTEALEILINDAKPGLMRDILVSAKTTVQSGRTLSDAFGQYKKFFPDVFTGLLRAGESSSQLDRTLEELSTHLLKEYALVKKIRSALVYPMLLLIASFGVVVFLLVFVLPRLVVTFKQSGAELPLITKILLGMSTFTVDNIFLLSFLLIVLVVSLIYVKRTPWGKLAIARVLFRLPVVKDLIKRVALVRFTRTLGSLLRGATPVIEALKTSSDAVGNPFYKNAISDVADKVRAGVPLSRGLQGHPDLFPTLLTSLIAVGERTGNLEYVLATFSDFYDQEVEAKLKDLTTLFEPILLMIMGIVVGTVAISILLPIYRLVGKFA